MTYISNINGFCVSLHLLFWRGEWRCCCWKIKKNKKVYMHSYNIRKWSNINTDTCNINITHHWYYANNFLKKKRIAVTKSGCLYFSFALGRKKKTKKKKLTCSCRRAHVHLLIHFCLHLFQLFCFLLHLSHPGLDSLKFLKQYTNSIQTLPY